jgi:hypothetical protein
MRSPWHSETNVCSRWLPCPSVDRCLHIVPGRTCEHAPGKREHLVASAIDRPARRPSVPSADCLGRPRRRRERGADGHRAQIRERRLEHRRRPHRGDQAVPGAAAAAPSGQDRGAFAAAYVPPRVKIPRGGVPAPCLISRDEIRCAWPAYCRRMCHRHYKSWDGARRERGLAWPEWESAAGPFTVALACPVGAMTGHGRCAYSFGAVRQGSRRQARRSGTGPHGRQARSRT